MEVEIDMSLIYNSNTTRRHPVISCGKNRSPSLIPRHYGGGQQTAVPSNRPNCSLRCKERLTMIKFYYHPSPNPAKVALFLEESGLPYEVVPVDTRKGEQFSPAFLAINPNSKTPAITDGEIRVFDSNAILLYLAEKTGKFLPENAN